MFYRIRLCLILTLAGLILAGCGWFDTLDPLGRIRRDVGAPITEAGRVTVGGQRVVFFRYQKGNQCGTGHVILDSGGAGWGGGACGTNAGITLPGAGAGSLPNGTMLATIEGELNNPSIVKVTITLADGTEVPAEVGGGMYFAAYIVPGGAQGLPDVVRVQGFDKDGKVVEDASAPGRQVTSPAANQVSVGASLPHAVQGGPVWVMVYPTDNVPADVVSAWNVGLTDSAQHSFLLGRLAGAEAEMGLYAFVVPEAAAAGEGRLWLSSAETPEASGTVASQIKILPFYGVVTSETLGIQFSQPKGWRLSMGPEMITLSHGPQEAAQPIEEIYLQRKADGWPDHTIVERTEEVTVAGQPAVRTDLQRQTVNATAFWHETHTVVRDVDIVLAYRPPLTAAMTAAYNQILDSLSFR